MLISHNIMQSYLSHFINVMHCYILQGVKQVLVKLGAKGSALFVQGEEPVKQPIISAPKVLDTTGAGDTFTAAFAVAFVEGKTKQECLRFAGENLIASHSLVIFRHAV